MIVPIYAKISPSKPIRLMVGLLLLKQLENLSDERVVLQFKRNPYYQYFCGYSNYNAKYALQIEKRALNEKDLIGWILDWI
jgi:hypothetical protein